jgi:hypothetical protein
VPIAVTLNEAACPAVRVAFFGCVVMLGATGGGASCVGAGPLPDPPEQATALNAVNIANDPARLCLQFPIP